MSKTVNILEKIKISDSDDQMNFLTQEFENLSPNDREELENPLIDLLQNKNTSKVVRAWMPSFLGIIGTPNAYNALFNQLPREKDDLVRRWIIRNIYNNFTGEDRILKLIKHLDKEPIVYNKRVIINLLGESGYEAAVPILIKYLKHDYNHVRREAAVALGKIGSIDALDALIHRIDDEKSSDVISAIIESFVIISDYSAAPSLLTLLRDESKPIKLQIEAAQALGSLAKAQSGELELVDEEAIQVLVEKACVDNRVLSITATDSLLKFLNPDAAAKRLVVYGLQCDISAIPRVADALRVIGGKAAIDHLRSIKEDSAEAPHAQILLAQIGGQQALDALMDRRMQALKQATSRVTKFDEKGVEIFSDTIKQAKRGFSLNLWMSKIIFGMGIVLLLISFYLMILPDTTGYQQLFSAGGGIAGLGTILTMFYRGPSERVDKAVTNLVQIEMAFLSYIRQVTQIMAMFEREYINDEFTITEMKKLLDYIEHSLKETMPLLHRFTIGEKKEKKNAN